MLLRSKQYTDSFEQVKLDKYALLCLIRLSMRLLNDDSVNCRRLVASAIRTLFNKVSASMKEQLFAITIDWLASDMVWIVVVYQTIVVCRLQMHH
jgi:hypothetical protein